MSFAITNSSAQDRVNFKQTLKPKFLQWFEDIRAGLDKSDRIAKLVIRVDCMKKLAEPIVQVQRIDPFRELTKETIEIRKGLQEVFFGFDEPAAEPQLDLWFQHIDDITKTLDKASLFVRGGDRAWAYSLRCVVEAQIMKPDNFVHLNKRVWDIKRQLQQAPKQLIQTQLDEFKKHG